MAKQEEQEQQPEEEKTPETAGEKKPEAEGKEPERTFTQSELNAILKDRLEREKSKFGDYDDLKAKAEQLDKLEEEQKSELVKAEERAEKAEAEAKAALERAEAIALRSAVVSAASRMEFTDPDDVFALLDKSALKRNEDGELEGLEDALKALAEAKPYLLKQTDDNKRPRRQSATNPGDNARPEGMSDEERAKLLGLG